MILAGAAAVVAGDTTTDHSAKRGMAVRLPVSNATDDSPQEQGGN